MKKFLAMLLAGVMLLSFAACGGKTKEKDGDNEKNKVEKQEGNGDYFVEENEETFEINSNNHANGNYYIESTTDFINGHALMILTNEAEDQMYYAVTDINGNITCKGEYSLLSSMIIDDTFEISQGHRIYIKKNSQDLVCKDVNGKTLYEVSGVIASGDNIKKVRVRPNTDGAVVLLREITDMFEGSTLQMAYISADGSTVREWSDLTVEGEKVKSGGVIYFDKETLWLRLKTASGSVSAHINLNDNTVYYDEAMDRVGGLSYEKIMHGYGYSTDNDVVNADGIVNTEVTYEESFFRYDASDCVAKGEYDNFLYDVATGAVISELPFNDDMRVLKCSAFRNGYSLFIFEGADGEEYLGLIDKNSQFKFDPIKLEKSMKVAYGVEANDIWDGEHILLFDTSKNKYIFLDANGQKVAEFSYKDIAFEVASTIKMPGHIISNGMVKASVWRDSSYRYTFIKYNGEMLFQDGRVSLD